MLCYARFHAPLILFSLKRAPQNVSHYQVLLGYSRLPKFGNESSILPLLNIYYMINENDPIKVNKKKFKNIPVCKCFKDTKSFLFIVYYWLFFSFPWLGRMCRSYIFTRYDLWHNLPTSTSHGICNWLCTIFLIKTVEKWLQGLCGGWKGWRFNVFNFCKPQKLQKIACFSA